MLDGEIAAVETTVADTTGNSFTSSSQDSATDRAVESLREWKESKKKKPIDKNDTVSSAFVDDNTVDEKKNDTEVSEKKSSEVGDTKDSKESENDNFEESGEETESDSGDVFEHTFDDEEEPSSDTDEVTALKDRLEKLEGLLDDKVETEKQVKYQDQIDKDMDLIKDPFQFKFDSDSYIDSLSESALDYFNDDPEAARFQMDLVSSAINKFMSDLNAYNESQMRVQQHNEFLKKQQQAKMISDLQAVGVDVNVFKTKDFANFESSPKNEKMIKDFQNRFGENSIEFARHVYDAYNSSRSKALALRQAKAKADAENSRSNISAKQKTADADRISGKGDVPSAPVDSTNPVDMLAKFRASRGR